MNTLSQLSTVIAAAVARAATSVVQVYSHRRPAAGVVFATDLIAVPARVLGDDTAVVRLPDGTTAEGQVLGYAVTVGLGVVRVSRLGIAPLPAAPEPLVGSLAIAIGRTWSGAVMATVTNVCVVGGPLRTGRSSQLERVIRIAQSPHGALTGGALVDGDGNILGIVSGSSIRGTTVVVPATLAWEAAHLIVKSGGTKQGYLGISSISVALPERQRAGDAHAHGLLVTAVAQGGPSDTAGLLIGDVIQRFNGAPVADAETLLTLLRGDHVGKVVTLTVVRGIKVEELAVTVGERP